MPITHLVTHSGGFHADELLSSVVLTRLYPDAQIMRSRDTLWTKPTPERIVYDVGRAYDPQHGMFDHHQRPNPLRPDGHPYSSFGLIWEHFGKKYLSTFETGEADLDDLHRRIDEIFVRPIDLLDNGAIEPSQAGQLANLTLPALLETLKPDFDTRTPEADDSAFATALPIARSFLEACLREQLALIRADTMVLKAIQTAGESRILELPMGMPFRSTIERFGAHHLLFVVHPRDGDWALNTIRISETSFTSKADLPAAWAGLTDSAFEVTSGVRGAKFCHNARFIAVAHSREAIMQLAEKAVEQAEETVIA